MDIVVIAGGVVVTLAATTVIVIICGYQITFSVYVLTPQIHFTYIQYLYVTKYLFTPLEPPLLSQIPIRHR